MVNTLIIYSISSLAVTIIPGPTMLLALSNGTTKNRKVILMGVSGAACSDFILISSVAIGLGAVMATSEVLFTIIKLVGVIYLFWLAYSLWFITPSDKIFSKGELESIVSTTASNAFYKSLFAALSNPKGLLFFSAFLPQFVDTSMPQLPQYISFAVVTVIIDVIIMGCYATAGFHLSRYLSYANIKLMNRACSLVLVFMASGLAAYRRTN